MAPRIGQLLLEKGLISEADLSAAERVQRFGDPQLALPPGEKLGRIIIRMGRVSATEVIRSLCEQQRFDDYILVGSYVISPSLVAEVPLEVAKRFSILPLVKLSREGDDAFFGTNRSHTAAETSEIEELLGLKIEWMELKEKDFDKFTERVYAQMAERGVRSVRIGEALVREGLVTHDEVEWALKIARRTNTRLGRVLVDEGLVVESKLYEVLARQKRVPLARAESILVEKDAPSVASKLSRTFAVFNEVVPFKVEDGKLFVATSDPETDLSALKKIYGRNHMAVHLVTLSDMVALLQAFYGLQDEEARNKGVELKSDSNGVALLDDVSDAEVGTKVDREELTVLRQRYERLVTNLLHEAIRRRASDIHIETYENNVLVRLRIDGLLYDARTLRIDRSNIAGVVNVIKVLCDMNIAERRVPQGGRFKKRTSSGQVFDFRVQVQPTLFGENIVIRLLNQSSSFTALSDLGFSRRHLDRYMGIIENPSGLALITGPTGSGKTTTLYSTLDVLRRDTTKKIVTIEDPIEYSVPRIQQSQTLDVVGYTFAEATRSFLRQDPDVALVGEIRDEETARETIKLSQTGHLVFSTLHTNTSIGAMSRMFVLGVDPELVAGELLVVLAQRLARRICPECRTPYTPDRRLVDGFYPRGVPSGTTFYRGAGCARCDGLGHVGRVALVEFWFIDHETRMLISQRADEDSVVKASIGTSFFPILADALEKVQQGNVDISGLPLVLPMASITRMASVVHDKCLGPQAAPSGA